MNTNSETWEQKAFAKDAAGHGPLGGCTWPPRSYSCSFCMREFRSAQALGGHMNVHRRDRARLKQCLNPNNTTTTTLSHHYHYHHHSHEARDHLSKSLSGAQFAIPDHDHQPIISSGHYLDSSNSSHSFVNAPSISCPFSPSRAPSALIQKENSGTERAFLSPYSSSTTTTTTTTTTTPAPSLSDSKSDHHQLEKNIMIRDYSICQLLGNDHGDHNVETDLSVGLNIRVVSRNRPGGSCGEEASSSCKRPKTSTISSIPFFLQSEEVAGLMTSSMEDNLDLELRLGDPPKVK